ncbi:Imm53 family immunity protein [Streptomyces canus]
MNESDEILGWLQDWYAAQSNDDWEHEWGVKIRHARQPQ